jgi:outer membrane protein assembly factor BamB
MILSEKITESVYGFKVYQDNLILNTVDGLKCTSIKTSENIWQSKTSAWFLRMVNDTIFYQIENGKELFGLCVCDFNEYQRDGEFYLFRSISFNDTLLIEDGSSIYLIDEQFSFIPTKLNRIPSVFINDKSVRKRQAMVVCEQIFTGEELWSLDVGGRILQTKLHLENVILSFEDGRILALSVMDGRKIWEKKAFPTIHIDKTKDKIYSIQGGFSFLEINALTGQVYRDLSDWSEQSEYPGLVGCTGVFVSIHDNFIIVPNNDTCEVFFLHKETAKVIDYVKLATPKKPSRQEVKIAEMPIYHQGKLFVLDSENTLHIYERDEHIG